MLNNQVSTRFKSILRAYHKFISSFHLYSYVDFIVLNTLSAFNVLLDDVEDVDDAAV